MGAHSSLSMTLKDARSIYAGLIGDPCELDRRQLEAFFDEVLDEKVYNCVIVEADSLEGSDYSDDSDLIRDYTVQWLEANPGKHPESLTQENLRLRRLLAFHVCGTLLYTDDDELQDNTEMPVIDFKRDSALEISRKLYERNKRRFVELGTTKIPGVD